MRAGPFSVAALRRAWLMVRRNKGGAGVDGVTLARFEAQLEDELVALALAIAEGRYRPQKVKRILVPKRKGGLRPIGIWVIRDRVVQRALFEALVPICERHFLPVSFGYRPGLGVKNALEVVVQARKAGLCWLVDADIKQCFDHIRTKPLLQMLGVWVPDRRLIELARCFLMARIFNSASGRHELAGTSQGSVLSPLLCNVYLHRLDEAISRKRGWRLVRFADDFVILTKSEQEAKAAKRLAAKVLGSLGLRLHPDKTRVVSFEQGFKFLGRFFLRDEVHKV
jgi:RNA-directed DNA polymerase